MPGRVQCISSNKSDTTVKPFRRILRTILNKNPQNQLNAEAIDLLNDSDKQLSNNNSSNVLNSDFFEEFFGNSDDFDSKDFTVSQLRLLGFNLFEKLSFIQNIIEQMHSILSEGFFERINSILSGGNNISATSDSNNSFHSASADKTQNSSLSNSFNIPDINFFEYRLNALVNAKMILPAHKELILKIISFFKINPNNPMTNDAMTNNPMTNDDLFNLFEKLISLPSAVLSSSSSKNPSENQSSALSLDKPYDFAQHPSDQNSSDHKSQLAYRSDNSVFSYETFDLPVDPVSRSQHLAVLDIMNQFNCDYISAYNILFNQLNK